MEPLYSKLWDGICHVDVHCIGIVNVAFKANITLTCATNLLWFCRSLLSNVADGLRSVRSLTSCNVRYRIQA